jgi:hypothetical protein
VLRRIIGLATIESGPNGIDVNALLDKNINLRTSGLGKAYYNDVEINTGGGGGGTGNKIVGSGCTDSAAQPTVECSPTGAPCEIRAIVGKGGKFRIMEST